MTADTQQAPIAVLLLSLTVVDGFVWPFAMMLAARRLLLRTELDGVRRAVRWSYVHHGLGGLAMFAAVAQPRVGSQGPMLAIAIGWATAGIAIAWSMSRALAYAQVLSRRESADHERADHERADHERADHERADHERADHERADHERAEDPRAPS
ncbi:MAG: hypothetical protein R3B99_34270 [Polyangiales bacterium]